MNKTTAPDDFEEIDRLIRVELGQALEKFRAGDFEARVRRRLAAEAEPVRRGASLVLKIAVPAAAVLVLVLAAAVLIFDPGPAPVRIATDAGPIAAVLRELPPFSGSAPDLAAGPAGETEVPGTGGAIASILNAAGAGKEGQEGPGPIRPDDRKVAPLTMKKRMEILFRDKVIERVLTSWAAKAKEA